MLTTCGSSTLIGEEILAGWESIVIRSGGLFFAAARVTRAEREVGPTATQVEAERKVERTAVREVRQLVDLDGIALTDPLAISSACVLRR